MTTEPRIRTNRLTSPDPGAVGLLTPITMQKLSRVFLAASIFALAACGDGPTAPEAPIDAVAAGRLMPSVQDARIRIVQGIDNASVRERALHDLQELERAMTSRDRLKARFHVRVLGSLVDEYKVQALATANGPDLTALSLVLYAVSQLVGAGYELGS